MEIRCKKEDCKFNTGCSCKAGMLEVDNKHHCATYSNDPLKEELIKEEGSIFEVADKIAPNHLLNVPLECAAKNCLYNKSSQCHADGISVIDVDEDSGDVADCATFCAQ